jgi:hypothetical protein
MMHSDWRLGKSLHMVGKLGLLALSKDLKCPFVDLRANFLRGNDFDEVGNCRPGDALMISTLWSILLNNVNRHTGRHRASPVNFFSRKLRALQLTVFHARL